MENQVKHRSSPSPSLLSGATPPSRLAPLAVLGALAVTSPAAAGELQVLVLKEHGVGTAAQAQPYVDKLVAHMGKVSGLGAAKGKYHATRPEAAKWVADTKPAFGILSLGAFLAWKDPQKLEVVGQVTSSRAGGLQYYLVSKNQKDLAGCKGKTLATDHADDTKFVDKVAFGGKAKLGDFTLVSTSRPLQTLKKVTAGEAECALIDDAQLAEMKNLEGGASLKAVWTGDKLPGMVVVAFGTASASEKKALGGALGKMCEGDGKTPCSEVGIQAVKAASLSDYQAVVTAYSK